MPGGVIEVRSEARSDPHELTLRSKCVPARRVRFLISHHVALNGDDGSAAGAGVWRSRGRGDRRRARAGQRAGTALSARQLPHRAAAGHGFEQRRRRRVAVPRRPVARTALRMHRHRAPRASIGLRLRGRLDRRAGRAAPMRRRGQRALAPHAADALPPAASPLARARRAPRRYRALVRAQRVRSLPVAARPRAVLGRRLGHARCVPGAGRAAAGARSRRRRSAICCCA